MKAIMLLASSSFIPHPSSFDLAVAEGFEPSRGRSNNPVPYQLGYATRELAAAARVELAHPRLQDECSVYPIELRRKTGGLGGIQTLTRSLQDFYAVGYITSPMRETGEGETR